MGASQSLLMAMTLAAATSAAASSSSGQLSRNLLCSGLQNNEFPFQNRYNLSIVPLLCALHSKEHRTALLWSGATPLERPAFHAACQGCVPASTPVNAALWIKALAVIMGLKVGKALAA